MGKQRIFQPELAAYPVTLRADADDAVDMLPPSACRANAASSVCSRFLHTSFSKDRSAVNAGCWTPDGRRMLTASAQGMFTLWAAFSFSFEATQQTHEYALHSTVWSHSG